MSASVSKSSLSFADWRDAAARVFATSSPDGANPKELAPSEWAFAAPWYRLLLGASLNGSEEAGALVFRYSDLIQKSWDTQVDEFRKELVDSNALPLSAESLERSAFLTDPFTAHLLHHNAGNQRLSQELAALRTAEPWSLSFGGPVDAVVEWIASGVVGNFAYYLFRRWITTAASPNSAPISDDEIAGFLAMYLDGRVGQPTDLILIKQQAERAGFRHLGPAGTSWHFVLVGPTVEYTIVLDATDGDSLPALVTYGRRTSPRSRYDELTSTGYCEPLSS